MLEEDAASRSAEARAPRRGLWIRILLACLIAVLILGVAVGQLVAQNDEGETPTTDLAAATQPSDRPSSTTSSTLPPTTTTTIPALVQPSPVVLPPVPAGGLSQGDRAMELGAYEQRLVDLHFDPGAVDGKFDEKLRFSVETVEKMLGWERDGAIDQPFVDAISNFQFPQPLVPAAEADRVEIDLDRQVLTVYKGYQVAVTTTTSTGNGKRFCGGNDGCQYAVTPPGRYTFQWHVNGWRDGDLGRLYNPWYFNGGIAVHGYQSVPTHPASHGCARIPMHISENLDSLVYEDMAVYVLGTQVATSGGPLGPGGGTRPAPPPPAPSAPPPAPAPTPPPDTTPTTAAPTTAAPTTAAPTTTAAPAPPSPIPAP